MRSARAIPWLLLLAFAACTCEDEEERRREILTTDDRKQARRKALDERRAVTSDGKLRPSDEVVAGLVLPRGLTLHRKFEYEWYYRTLRRQVTLERLEEYFRPQLVTLKLERDPTGGVHFLDAQLKKDPTARQVSVRISPVLTGIGQNEVYIKQRPPAPKHFPTAAEAKAKMEARRRHAD